MTARLPDWEARLLAWIDAVAAEPFAWGRNDCALFAAGAVEAQTGQDFGAPFRGRYSSEAGAAKALRRAGHADVAGPFTSALGEPVAPLALGFGDVASDGANVGIVGRGALLFAGEDGIVRRPLSAAVRGWKV